MIMRCFLKAGELPDIGAAALLPEMLSDLHVVVLWKVLKTIPITPSRLFFNFIVKISFFVSEAVGNKSE